MRLSGALKRSSALSLIHIYYNNGLFFLVTLVLDVLVIMGTACLCRQLQQIRDMGAALAAGNLEAKIDTRKMARDIKRHAENLNAIGTGMTKACLLYTSPPPNSSKAFSKIGHQSSCTYCMAR